MILMDRYRELTGRVHKICLDDLVNLFEYIKLRRELLRIEKQLGIESKYERQDGPALPPRT